MTILRWFHAIWYQATFPIDWRSSGSIKEILLLRVAIGLHWIVHILINIHRGMNTHEALLALSDEHALMERESVSLAREFKVAEQTYGADNLDTVLATGYLSKLLRNAGSSALSPRNFQELLFEFQKITEVEATAA